MIAGKDTDRAGGGHGLAGGGQQGGKEKQELGEKKSCKHKLD